MSPTSVHELAVGRLIEEHPRLRRKGFSPELRRIMTAEGICDQLWWEAMRPNFIPDAFLFDTENREIHLYEIEDTRPLSKKKLHKLVMYWFDLDGDNWKLRVFVTDRYGQSIRELSLADLWYEKLRRKEMFRYV